MDDKHISSAHVEQWRKARFSLFNEFQNFFIQCVGVLVGANNEIMLPLGFFLELWYQDTKIIDRFILPIDFPGEMLTLLILVVIHKTRGHFLAPSLCGQCCKLMLWYEHLNIPLPCSHGLWMTPEDKCTCYLT